MDVSLSLPAASMTLIEAAVASAVDSHFASRLAAADDSLWGPSAQPEASIRLGWTQNPSRFLGLCAEIQSARNHLAKKGISRVIVCGMGGSSLGPEVLSRRENAPLTVVDSTHPDVLAPVVLQNLSEAVIVISSKSGTTIETDSQLRLFSDALQEQGLDPADHLVILTDPHSALHEYATAHHLTLFLGEPDIGGRYSILSPFGLVPAGLAGVDIENAIQEAAGVWARLSADTPDNPALLLGAAIALGSHQSPTLLLKDDDYSPGLASWVEQLVAESSGKEGRGILPVVGSSLHADSGGVIIGSDPSSAVRVSGALGELVALWQVATAFACFLLEVNPLDQPNVESAKVAARAMLTGSRSEENVGHPVAGGRYWVSTPLTGTNDTPRDLVQALLSQVGEDDYLALMVYGVERESWERFRLHLEKTVGRPVTLGIGPRFLHSTGQLHKGGPARGVFLSILEIPHQTLAIPGRDFDCGALVRAQAYGDRDVLISSGRPVLALELDSQTLDQLIQELGKG